jgi:hypothetical protein
MAVPRSTGTWLTTLPLRSRLSATYPGAAAVRIGLLRRSPQAPAAYCEGMVPHSDVYVGIIGTEGAGGAGPLVGLGRCVNVKGKTGWPAVAEPSSGRAVRWSPPTQRPRSSGAPRSAAGPGPATAVRGQPRRQRQRRRLPAATRSGRAAGRRRTGCHRCRERCRGCHRGDQRSGWGWIAVDGAEVAGVGVLVGGQPSVGEWSACSSSSASARLVAVVSG